MAVVAAGITATRVARPWEAVSCPSRPSRIRWAGGHPIPRPFSPTWVERNNEVGVEDPRGEGGVVPVVPLAPPVGVAVPAPSPLLGLARDDDGVVVLQWVPTGDR